MGQANVGKSTLLAALLGEDLSPRRNGPCTAAPIEFSWGPDYRIEAHYRRTFQRPVWSCLNAADVLRHLVRLADEAECEARERPARIRVQVPLSLLETGLVIADTPGFGAAQSEPGCEGTHEESLRRYLVTEVSQVLWVVLAEAGIGKREQLFHEEFLAAVCDDVVVTGCDDWSEGDQQRFRRRFSPTLGLQSPEFHFVSGRQALRARLVHDNVGLEAAGIPDLERRIRDMANTDARIQALTRRMTVLCQNLGAWFNDYRDARREPLRTWWRPDSWSRWTELPRCSFKTQLDEVLQQGAT